MAGENVEKVEGEKEAGEEKVSLDRETYNALLDRVSELEALSVPPKKGKDDVVDIDELAEEGRSSRKQTSTREEEVDFDSMSNTQLVQFLSQRLDEALGARLSSVETTVETLKVLREIDKAEAKHEDFWDYKDEIKSISIRNPTLSIEEAYQLAKSGKPPKEKGKEGEEKVVTTRTEKLLKLPPRVSGEKPTGVAPSATKTGQTKGIKSAAEKAWDDVVGKGKVEI